MAWNRYIKLHGRAKEISAILVEFKRQTRGFFVERIETVLLSPGSSSLSLDGFLFWKLFQSQSIFTRGKPQLHHSERRGERKGKESFVPLDFFSSFSGFDFLRLEQNLADFQERYDCKSEKLRTRFGHDYRSLRSLISRSSYSSVNITNLNLIAVLWLPHRDNVACTNYVICLQS